MGTDRLGSLLTTAAFIFLLALVAVGLGALNIPFPEDQLDKRVNAVTELLKVTTTAFGGIAVLINAYHAAKRAEAMDKSAIAAEKNIEIGLKNAELTEERLITERFGKAVEQLGDESLQIRLGGIYALERIAKDSDRDYWPVMEVLTAFIREDTRSREVEMGKLQDFSVSTDIQAALTVLGRRTKSHGKGEEHPLDLAGTDLRGAKLQNSNFEKAIFTNADLQGADLTDAKLRGASFENACLEGASLASADLSNTYMYQADLANAGLDFTNFQEARLHCASLFEADLWGTNFQGIDGMKTNFEKAKILQAEFQKAGSAIL